MLVCRLSGGSTSSTNERVGVGPNPDSRLRGAPSYVYVVKTPGQRGEGDLDRWETLEGISTFTSQLDCIGG